MSDGNKEKNNISELHNEIKAGKQLKASNKQELEDMARDRQERMEKVTQVKVLFENAQSMLDELVSSPVSLSKVPEIDLKAIQLEKATRLKQIESLRDTLATTGQLMEEIKGGVHLSPPPKSEQDLHNKEKAQRMDLFLQANKQLTSFGNIIEEISHGEFELQKVDPVEQEAHNKARLKRLEEMRGEVEQFSQFGDILEELSSGEFSIHRDRAVVLIQ